jgi:dephospho-CoA kinase
VSQITDKYVIGLTGNIATGKSVVRRMLEHLGAYTIDADALAHRAIAKGAPGYQPVLERFGKWLLDANGEIDRTKLGKLVFNDPEALRQLEDIIHPLVEQATVMLIRRATQRVVVVEAIKLLESELRRLCDTIWVTDAPQEIQITRLMRKRGLSREEALLRVHAQSAQKDKLTAANVILRNTGSYEDLWKQVSAEWKKITQAGDTTPVILKEAQKGEFAVQRGRPRDAEVIATLINRLSNGKQKMTTEDVMAAFGDRAYLLLQLDGQPVGLVGWQVENLVARVTDLHLEKTIDPSLALETLLNEVERASRDLQCEAALVFVEPALAQQPALWKKLGYEQRTPQSLGVQAWQEAALESMPAGSLLFFKQLRQDRVLRPI